MGRAHEGRARRTACVLAIAAALALAITPTQGFAQQRANVLFIAIDDLNDWVGPLGGHPQTKTPNIDRLAERGMTFTNAHSPSALCNPSRTALLSGLRPSSSGVYGNAPDWRTLPVFDGLPTLPHFFRDHGYATYGGGKIFHAHTFGAGGYAGFNDTAAWDEFYPSLDRQLTEEVRPAGVPVNRNPLMTGFDWAAVVVDDRAMGDGQVVAYAERKLEAASTRPQFTAVGIFRPHLPWYVPQAYFDMHPLDRVELPVVVENDLADLPVAGRRSTFQGVELYDWVVEHRKWQEAVQAYLASVSFADAMVGRLLDALDRSGRADDTIVVLWGDHGFHLGEKRRFRKMTLWDESTHVPLIVVAPGVSTPGSRTAQAVSLMDLYPTLAELAGLEVPPHVEGESLVPLIRDPGAEREMPAVVTYGFGNHAVRDARYRYIRYADGTEELYDVEHDPHEWVNRADDPALRRVKRRLADWLPETNVPDAIGSATAAD